MYSLHASITVTIQNRNSTPHRRTLLCLTDRVRFGCTDNRLSAKLSRISVLNSSARIPQLAVRR
ncbi:hypothetical protein T03_17235 [Trichinella britovi]|uniref:Uncharacterized protein n=1 Tax=Trichinella britovi TaxID=45882 RepID=A0A0V1B140_TRIBR|nr:hypothetical protein T03_17235 [Trichinella britovi]